MRHFDGVTSCMAPFVGTVTGNRVKPALLEDVAAARTEPCPVVPQVLANAEKPFAVMLKALKALGHTSVNLNAGCPWPHITRKGRGAGLLVQPACLWRLLDAGCAVLPDGLSIKLRLGIDSPRTLAGLLPFLNAYPLEKVIIHPRTALQGYTGTVNLEAFAECLSLCRHPVVYNGDIFTPSDWKDRRLRFPGVRHWMIGRGLLVDPFLIERLRTGSLWPDPGRVQAFLVDYRDALRQARPDDERRVLGRLKAFGYWFCKGLPEGESRWTAVRRVRTLAEYDRLCGCWFSG